MMTTALIVSAALFAGLVLALGFTALTARLRVHIDLTPVEHAIVAAAQAGWGYATGDWWAGAAIGIAIFIGREHAQAEYRLYRLGLSGHGFATQAAFFMA
jgi:hypothetical protein